MENKGRAFIEFRTGHYAAAMKLLRPLAEAGDAQCQYRLGICYQKANRPMEGYPWIEKAARQGDVDACIEMSTIYFIDGTPEGEKRGFEWAEKAHDTKDPKGIAYLGFCYEQGQGCKKNERLGQKLQAKAEKMGYEGRFGAIGKGTILLRSSKQKEIDEGLLILEQAARKGEAMAYRELARYYERNGNAQKSYETLLEGAEKANSSLCARLLANLLAEKDPAEAAKWYRKGHERHDHQCTFALGNAYLAGAGVTQDEGEGLKLIYIAASQEYRMASEALASHYAEKSTKDDVKMALHWARRSAYFLGREGEEYIAENYPSLLNALKDPSNECRVEGHARLKEDFAGQLSGARCAVMEDHGWQCRVLFYDEEWINVLADEVVPADKLEFYDALEDLVFLPIATNYALPKRAHP